MRRTRTTHSGWDAITLESPSIAVTVVPLKGADITSIRHRGKDIELLWAPRWGLRPPDIAARPGDPEAVAMDSYGGGWNTLFPNGGRSSTEYGTEWGFHGEAWVAPFRCDDLPDGIRARTTLVRSPFDVEKLIRVDDCTVSVTERVTNVGAQPIDVLWCQHPAFGAPLIGPTTTVEVTACAVNPDVSDPAYARSVPVPRWPAHTPPGGRAEVLSQLPGPDAGTKRRAFLGDFADRSVTARIWNPDLELGVRVSWDRDEFPYAWYWLEAGGRADFPWFGAAYVFAIEPATGYPSGVRQARELTGTHVTIAPGATLSKTVSLTVED